MSSGLKFAGVILALLFGTFATAVAQEQALKIGFLTPKSGPLAGPGKQMEDGVRYFLNERNNILAGRKIELIVADTAGQPAMARSKAQELVERDQVQVIIGPLATTELLAIDDYIKEAKVPLISPSALAEDVTQRNVNPWLLRATASTGQIVHPLGDYAANAGKYKRVATITTDWAYGYEAAAGFQRVFEDNGGKVVQKIWVPLKVSDFAAYITQIKLDADAVFASFSGASATGFIRQYREYGLKGKLPLLATQSTVDESLLKDMGDDAIGVTSSGIYSAAIDTPTNKAYVAGFSKAFGVDPGFYSTGAYVAGLFLEQALKTTQGKTEDKPALMKALRGAKLADSPRGPLAIDEYGNPLCDIYIRKAERVGDRIQNTTVKVYKDQSQFWTFDPKEFLANPVYSRDFPASRFLQQ